MAYGSREFMKDLAIYTAGGAIGLKNSAKFLSYAGKKGIQLAAFTAPNVGSVARAGGSGLVGFARRRPAAAAALAGFGAQQLGAFDPVEEAIEAEVERRVSDVNRGIQFLQTPVAQKAAVKVAKRKVSKYSKAVKAGMSAVKRSKFLGAKGKLSNAKTAFSKVNKVASAVNKGKKVASKGVTGVIKRAVGRFL